MTLNYGKLLENQRNYFSAGKTRAIEFRIENLKRLKQTIIKHTDEIMTALENDFSKCWFETFASEIMCVLEEINIALKNLHSWAAPARVKTPLAQFKATSRIYYEPFESFW